MSETYPGGCAGDAIRFESENAAAFRAADWLGLAAAPTFAAMALLTGVFGGNPPDILCSATDYASALSGMIPMYLLMTAFHSVPWLKLILSRRTGARCPSESASTRRSAAFRRTSFER